MCRCWRNIAIALVDAVFGEQKAQTCENAWFRQLSSRPLPRYAKEKAAQTSGGGQFKPDPQFK